MDTPKMSTAKTANRLTCLRWNLNPTAAALWQLASRQACQDLPIRASWIELEPHWNPGLPFESEAFDRLHRSIHECRLNAFIVGVERANLDQIAGNACKLREFCDRLSYQTHDRSEATMVAAFLIAWFPQADRESFLILRELGFDLVLHNPWSLQSTLRKIALCNTTDQADLADRAIDRSRL